MRTFGSGIETALRDIHNEDWAKLADRPIASGTFRSKDVPAEVNAAIEDVMEFARGHVQNSLARRTAAAYDLVREFDEYYWYRKRDLGAIRFDDVPQVLTDLSILVAKTKWRIAWTVGLTICYWTSFKIPAPCSGPC